mgnify:FL=1
MLEQINAFTINAHRLASTPRSAAIVATLLRRVSPFLRLFADQVGRHISSFLEWHKASLKLAYVLTSVVKELSVDGFCRPSDDDGKGDEAGANGKTTDGTGMADGQGATNVSKDIEEESQVEGLQNDVEKEKEEKPEEKEGDDDAVEMSLDFEGEMEDRGDGEKDEKEDGDDESDTESQPDPEEQIADVDPLDPSSVDEKFWGDEASKEGANEEVNEETTKSAGEAEMAAKDEDANAPQPKGEKGEEVSAEDEKKDQPTAEDGAELDGDGEEDGSKEGEDEDEEGDAAPQADDGERLDERMPEAENLDLPDDMQLDGEDKKDDDFDLGSDMGDLEGESWDPLAFLHQADFNLSPRRP